MNIPDEFHSRPGDQTVRRATDMKHAKPIPFLHVLTFENCDIARRDFGHPHRHNAHETDIGVVGLDEDYRTGCHLGDVALRVDRSRVVEPYRWCLRVIGTGVHVGFHHRASDGAVPAVIAKSAQESLIYCPANELRGESVASKHVRQRVRLSLDPETVKRGDIGSKSVGSRFAGVHDDPIILWSCYGTFIGAELSREEVVPGFESTVWLSRITDEIFDEIGHVLRRKLTESAYTCIGAEYTG